MKNPVSMDSRDEQMMALHKQVFPNENLPIAKKKGKAKVVIEASYSPFILNFANTNSFNHHWPLTSPTKASDQVHKHDESSKTRSEKYDHVVAERRRREHISQQFIALSGMVPGLKKMDKTSVLVDTIEYMKKLQERLKTLEEKRRKHTMESVVLVRKSQIRDDLGFEERSLPEIEAKMYNNSVFIKIHCEKQKGVLADILSSVEKLNLIVVNINVAPLGNLALCVTITAEMKKEFNSSVQNLVEDLRSGMVHKIL